MPEGIAGFDVLEQIGEGGMGVVFKARDRELDRVVALKLLRQGFDSQEARQRFRQEARSAASLEDPNIITIYSFGEHRGAPFIAMEFVRGRTLDGVIRLRTPLTLVRKLSILESLCSGLGYAHRRNIIHRDIKPSNLMLSTSGVLKILDFGIAKALHGAHLTRTRSLIGTPNYMAPEQFLGTETADKRTDIFSVGAVCYELLTYEKAFPGELMEAMNLVVHHEPRPMSSLCPSVDPQLEALVSKALSKNPDQRFQDLVDLRHEIAKIRQRLELETSEAPDLSTTEILAAGDEVAVPFSPEATTTLRETIRVGVGAPDVDHPAEEAAVAREEEPVRRERSSTRSKPMAAGRRWAGVTMLIVATIVGTLAWRYISGRSVPQAGPPSQLVDLEPHSRATSQIPNTSGSKPQSQPEVDLNALRATRRSGEHSVSPAPSASQREPKKGAEQPVQDVPVPPAPVPPADSPSQSKVAAPVPTNLPLDRPAESPPVIDSAAAQDKQDKADRQAIEAVINAYKEAYERLDAAALGRVWPSGPDLTHELKDVRSYHLELLDPVTLIQGETAKVTCVHKATVQYNVGKAQTGAKRVTILLARVSAGWVITGVQFQ